MPAAKKIATAIKDGEFDLAGQLIASALDRSPNDPALIALRGRWHHANQDYKAAVSDLKQALGSDAGQSEWHNALGKSLNNLQQVNGAERAFRSAVAAAPDYAEAWHNLGHVLRAKRENAGALESFETATRIDPSYAAAWHNAGLMHLLCDDLDSALDRFEKALALEPDRPRLNVHTGVALHHLGRHEESIAAYRRAIKQNPEDAEALNNLAISLRDSGHTDEALARYEEASRLAPNDLQIRIAIADLLISIGRAPEAIEIASDCLQIRPGMTAALAIVAVANQEPGCVSPIPGLMDFHRLTLHEALEPPDGQTIGEFNRELSDFVVAHPTLAWEPPGHATRKGSHTSNLLLGDKGPVAHLEKKLAAAIERYTTRVAEDDCHFMLDGRPASWKLTMWSVVMDSQGHQLAHIHPSAWLSGVYYAQIPDEIDAADDSHAGWIEFGAPPESLNCQSPHATVSHHPDEGEFFLFPSYFYHRTIPFDSRQRRICLAFDVIPDQ